jgi:hypothetical protein
LKNKIEQQTVTLRRAHWGTRVPSGTGLGKLEKGFSVRARPGNPPPQKTTHDETEVVVQFDAYSDQLMADKPRENRRKRVMERT